MTRPILLVSTLFSIAACHFQPRQADCSKFRAGEFYFVNKQTGNKYRIVRNDVNQFEEDEKRGIIGTFGIKWISPCEYELTLLSRKSISSDTSLTPMPALPVTRTLITEVGDNYYVFETKVDGINIVYSDTMRVIKTR